MCEKTYFAEILRYIFVGRRMLVGYFGGCVWKHKCLWNTSVHLCGRTNVDENKTRCRPRALYSVRKPQRNAAAFEIYMLLKYMRQQRYKMSFLVLRCRKLANSKINLYFHLNHRVVFHCYIQTATCYESDTVGGLPSCRLPYTWTEETLYFTGLKMHHNIYVKMSPCRVLAKTGNVYSLSIFFVV